MTDEDCADHDPAEPTVTDLGGGHYECDVCGAEWFAPDHLADAFSRLESVTSQEAATIEQLIEERDEAHVQRKKWKVHALRLEQKLAGQSDVIEEMGQAREKAARLTVELLSLLDDEWKSGQ